MLIFFEANLIKIVIYLVKISFWEILIEEGCFLEIDKGGIQNENIPVEYSTEFLRRIK